MAGRNAIEVRIPNGMVVGYVPEKYAEDVAPLLDADHPYDAYVKKILTGGRSPIPVVVAQLYSREATLPKLKRAADAPLLCPSPDVIEILQAVAAGALDPAPPAAPATDPMMVRPQRQRRASGSSRLWLLLIPAGLYVWWLIYR